MTDFTVTAAGIDSTSLVGPQVDDFLVGADGPTPHKFEDRNTTIVGRTDNFYVVRTNGVLDAGKWYFEAKIVVVGNASQGKILIGLSNVSAGYNLWVRSDGFVTNGATSTSSATPAVPGMVYRFAIDFDAGKLWIGQNGSWIGGGDPETGVSPTCSFPYGIFSAIAYASNDGDKVSYNFGAGEFAYSVPTGFAAWNDGTGPFLGATVEQSDAVPLEVALESIRGTLRLSGERDSLDTYELWLGLAIAADGLTISVLNNDDGGGSVNSRRARRSGKLYAEATILGLADWVQPIGLTIVTDDGSNWLSYMVDGDGTVWSDATGNVPGGDAPVEGGVYRMAVDLDQKKIWLGDGTGWFGGGDPAVGTNPTMTIDADGSAFFYFAAFSVGDSLSANLGTKPFNYDMPVGFTAWDTLAPDEQLLVWQPIAFDSIEPTANFGSPYLSMAVAVEAIQPLSQLGPPIVGGYVGLDGIDSTLAIGDPAVTQTSNITPQSAGGTVQTGAPIVSATASISELTAASAATTGAPTASALNTANPLSIEANSALGQPSATLTPNIGPTGISSILAFGTPAVSTVNAVAMPSIDPAAAIGNPSIAVAALQIDLPSITPATSLGQPTITGVIGVGSVDSSVQLGQPIVTSSAAISDLTITPRTAFDYPTVTLGSVWLSPTPIAAIATFGDPVISEGGVIVAVFSAIRETRVADPTVTRGPVGLSVQGLDAGTQVGTPTAQPGVAVVAGPSIGPTATFGSSTVTTGPVMAVMNGIGPVATVGQFTVRPAIGVLDLTIVPGSQIGQPGAAPGAARILLSTVAPVTDFGRPAITTGPVSVGMQSIASTASMGAFRASQPQTVAMSSVEPTGIAGDPAVSRGPARTFMSSIEPTFGGGKFVMTVGPVSIGPSDITSQATFGAPKVMPAQFVNELTLAPTTVVDEPEARPGSVTAKIGSIASTFRAYAFYVQAGPVSAELGSVVSALRMPTDTFITLHRLAPTERTWRVPSDIRVASVGVEDRVIRIGHEDRVVAVEAENRVFAVEPDNDSVKVTED